MEMDKNLVREVIAKRVAQEFHDGYVVNLGIGLPTLVANYVGDMDVIFQSENGCIGGRTCTRKKGKKILI